MWIGVDSRMSNAASALLFVGRAEDSPSGHAGRTTRAGTKVKIAALLHRSFDTRTMSSENTARRGQGKAVGFMAGGFAVLSVA
jgi:hypothetical protein